MIDLEVMLMDKKNFMLKFLVKVSRGEAQIWLATLSCDSSYSNKVFIIYLCLQENISCRYSLRHF